MKKRLLVIMLACCMLLGVSACGAGKEEKTAGGNAATGAILETTDEEAARKPTAALRETGATVGEDMTDSDIDSAQQTPESEKAADAGKAEVKPVEVYDALDYPDDDWRCAGFYLDGNLVKLPITYEELSNLGFDSICKSIIGSYGSVDSYLADGIMVPAYSCYLKNFYAYNSAEEEIPVYVVNVTAEEQDVHDCMFFMMCFTTPAYEHRMGYEELPKDVRLCNGISWDTTYEEVIELMGEADQVSDVSDENGFSGTLIYYMEEGNRDRNVQIEFFHNMVDSFTIQAMPIDAHKKISW